MKLAAKLFIAIYLTLFVFSIACAATTTTKPYYTKVNIWYEDSGKILSTNYHRGAIIPFCTKVNVISQTKEKINFTTEDQPGITFALINVPRHSLVNTTELFKQYFTQDNPKAGNTEFNKFSAKEKDSIENGTLIEGMSKEAVIAAYGYPPKHKTPLLTSNLWTYWDARYLRKLVIFKNNVVTKLEEIKEEYAGRPRWYW
ncbi:MAG: hypothetical protein NTX01_00905 [Candidatus Omnitrophica bacterium]|nr:hypothetical protein [Candidatus Omnitrophota bacterium]